MKELVKCQLGKMELFNNLDQATINSLSELGESKCYLKGSHIFRDKDEINKVYIVYSGKVALYKLNESAQKKIIFILGKESILNAVVLDDLPASINCEVFEKAEVLSFDRMKFQEIMMNDFELTKIVISSLSI